MKPRIECDKSDCVWGHQALAICLYCTQNYYHIKDQKNSAKDYYRQDYRKRLGINSVDDRIQSRIARR